MSHVAERFLDTNVLIRHLTQDHADHSPRSSRLIADVFAGIQIVHVSETMIFETVFTLSSMYKVPRAEISEVLIPFLRNQHIRCHRRLELTATLEYWAAQTPLSYADCYHLTLARSLGLTEIYSFDKKIDRFPDVTRVEP